MHSAQVCDGVWIGSSEARADTEWLARNKIVLIVDCRDDGSDAAPEGLTVHRCHLRDDDKPLRNRHAQATAHRLQGARVSIERAVRNGHTVLVHCHSGVNRSALVICWWLMKRETGALDYRSAVDLVTAANRLRQEPALINQEFARFLIESA